MKLLALFAAIFALFAALVTAQDTPYGLMIVIEAKNTQDGQKIEDAMTALDFNLHCAYGVPPKIDIAKDKKTQWYGMATTDTQQAKAECERNAVLLAIQPFGGTIKDWIVDKKWNYSACVDTNPEDPHIICTGKTCEKGKVCNSTIMASTLFAFALVVALFF